MDNNINLKNRHVTRMHERNLKILIFYEVVDTNLVKLNGCIAFRKSSIISGL